MARLNPTTIESASASTSTSASASASNSATPSSSHLPSSSGTDSVRRGPQRQKIVKTYGSHGKSKGNSKASDKKKADKKGKKRDQVVDTEVDREWEVDHISEANINLSHPDESQYLVHWSDVGTTKFSEPTWEPVTNLSGAAVQDFWMRKYRLSENLPKATNIKIRDEEAPMNRDEKDSRRTLSSMIDQVINEAKHSDEKEDPESET
ncbi:hypothetical protein F5Y03DRAFT_376566 [Xylaria venustula]|nr:hypothetical protein F5Y03DRAFT_376566 [Xylaria venustula]